MIHEVPSASEGAVRTLERVGPVSVVCVGNELARDDGVGIRLGRILQRLPLPQHMSVRLCPQIDLDVIDVLLEAERVVLCDATRLGLAPGTITVNDWRYVASQSDKPYCCHSIGLADLIAIAAELAPLDVGREIVLLGVEAETLDEFGTQLSPRVQAALPAALDELLQILQVPQGLREMGASEAGVSHPLPAHIAATDSFGES
jgi:hydrogenase maturation protease